MKTNFFIIALLFAAQASTDARIGETSDELVRRYGKPTFTKAAKDGQPEICAFHFNHFDITVCLLNGRSASETFIETSPVKQGNGTYANAISMTISDTSKDMVLGANSRGKRWERIGSLNWFGEQWDVGSEHPIDKSKLLNAWKLAGERIFCAESRRSMPAGFCELRLFTQEYSDVIAPLVQKERENEVKKSGL
jgi:hypothetical protein